MNRYDRYPGDYLTQTLTLSLAQDGAYTRLLDHYYTIEKPIPVDEVMAVARCRNTEDEAVTQWVLARFFTLTEMGYRHARADKEIAKARPRIEAARNNGLRGGRPPNKPSGLASGLASGEPSGNPGRKLPSPSPSLIKLPKGNSSPAMPATTECPHQQIIDSYHEHLPMLPAVKVWDERRAKLLRTRWREDPKRQTPEWWGKYFRYVGDKCPFLVGQGDSAGDRQPFVASLEWLIKPANMAKVIEGNYERR